jgi:hypothetical protein
MFYVTMIVKRTEWEGDDNCICADECLFKRSTLLVYNGISVVVATIAAKYEDINDIGFFDPAHDYHYFKTKIFYDKKDVTGDEKEEVHFASPWQVMEITVDDKANYMHEAVCYEIEQRLKDGDNFGILKQTPRTKRIKSPNNNR